ncbi:Abi family protein [Stappia sp. ES.058]|uniref:Abi family protein n=1 Tax=Stappia sp. ES.058 TaxID=1881061 RepID=UPI00352AD7E8
MRRAVGRCSLLLLGGLRRFVLINRLNPCTLKRSWVATLSKEVQKGGPSYFQLRLFFGCLPVVSNPFNKPHATAHQRVAHLRSRGLVITRPNVAARNIEEIGYERLRIYFLSRRDGNLPSKPFVAGTTYQHILRLYECDTKFRMICFASVCHLEIVFRNRLSEVLSARFGSHPYFVDRAFKNTDSHREALKKILSVFAETKDQRAKHYSRTYTEPPLPPIWMLKEFLTFGTAVRLYAALQNSVR